MRKKLKQHLQEWVKKMNKKEIIKEYLEDQISICVETRNKIREARAKRNFPFMDFETFDKLDVECITKLDALKLLVNQLDE